MYDLHRQGLSSREIADRCAAGLASVERFEIPARSVREIVRRMEQERGASRVDSLEDATEPDAQETVPGRVQRVLDRELTRIEAKQGPLSDADLGRLARIGAIQDDLDKREARARRRVTPPPRETANGDHAANGNGSGNGGSLLDQFAAEEGKLERQRIAEEAAAAANDGAQEQDAASDGDEQDTEALAASERARELLDQMGA